MKTYLRHRIRNVIDVRELTAMEFLDFEGKYRSYVESHDFWELCYVVRGAVTLKAEDTAFALGERELLLIPPNKSHSYTSARGNESRVLVVCFDSFSQSLNALSNCIFFEDPVQSDCMEKIMDEGFATFRMNERDQMEVLPSPKFGGQQALLIQLEYLLITLVRRRSAFRDSDIVFFSDERFHADLVNAVLRFLRKSVATKLTLQEICAKFSYSRSFLCRIFKEQTGETLIGCFNRLKIEEAKRRLAEGSDTVSAISCSLGFREVKYFDTLFKKQTGLSPLAYREKHKKGELL